MYEGREYKQIDFLSELWHPYCPVEPVNKTYELTYYHYREIVERVWKHYQ